MTKPSSFVTASIPVMAISLCWAISQSAGQDLKDFERRLGTTSKEAAERFEQGVKAYRSSQGEESVKLFQDAI